MNDDCNLPANRRSSIDLTAEGFCSGAPTQGVVVLMQIVVGALHQVIGNSDAQHPNKRLDAQQSGS